MIQVACEWLPFDVLFNLWGLLLGPSNIMIGVTCDLNAATPI